MNVVQMLFEIGLNISQFGRDLSESEVDLHRMNLTMKEVETTHESSLCLAERWDSNPR